METVVSPPASSGDELRLLTNWEDGRQGSRTRQAALISLVLHALAIAGLAVLPPDLLLQPAQQAVARHITPLIAPLTEPTQITPNKGPLSKQFDAETLEPRPRIHIPPSPPSTRRPAARTPSFAPPVAPGPPAPPVQAVPEPPRIEAAGNAPPSPVVQPLAQLPPRIQAEEKPRLETPAPPPTPRPGGRVAIPNSSISEAVRSASRGGGGGLMVGDQGEPGLGGLGDMLNLPPSPGRQASNLELLSDPMGVDFRPYLIKILSSVRRNWFAVMPESAKLGRQGRVGIQFAISRDGSVPKLVIVNQSGTDALDRAAVAGISASNPFPPLPAEFKGAQIRLQFNFTYNASPSIR